MKIFLVTFLSCAVMYSKFANAGLCDSHPKKPIASAFYHDKEYNFDIFLGKFFIVNSNLIFEQDANDSYDKRGIPIEGDSSKIDSDKIIRDYKKNHQVKIKIKKNMIKSINNFVQNGGGDRMPTDQYLDIETKKIHYMELRISTSDVCDNGFLEGFIYGAYVKYGVLIVPNNLNNE